MHSWKEDWAASVAMDFGCRAKASIASVPSVLVGDIGVPEEDVSGSSDDTGTPSDTTPIWDQERWNRVSRETAVSELASPKLRSQASTTVTKRDTLSEVHDAKGRNVISMQHCRFKVCIVNASGQFRSISSSWR